jgi:putative ABC transport system substrate-binding protein
MRFNQLRRREFITLIGGSATAWPFAAAAQQSEGTRRIGVLMSTPANDKEGQARINAFVQSLRELGWVDGHNVQIETRWAAEMRTAVVNLLRNWLR